MTSFNSGFQLGATMYNNAERNRLAAEELDLAKARDARAAEEFGWRRDQLRREDEAFANFNNAAGGIDKSGQTQLQQTYGMTPEQISRGLQNGGAAGLRTQLAGYDAPDSYDLQRVPAAATGGAQPGRFTADQLQTREPSRMDIERAMGGLALARRDVAGMRASQLAQTELHKSELASKVMGMSTEDLDKLAPDINQSGYPLLYTGKGKGGYTFLKTEADGKTPIAGSEFKLNESQLRQMALAHELGTAGYGTEAMQTLSAAHKDIGDHVSKWNDAITKSATTNNQAVHASNTDSAQLITAQSNRDVRNEQIRSMRDLRENREAAGNLMDKWDTLTPEQQNGPEGDALIKQFNMLNVKAGGQVGLQHKGGKTGPGTGLLSRGVDQKKNDDGTYTAFDKTTGQALYNTINGEAIPLGMDNDTYAGMKKAARDNGVKMITGEENGRLIIKFQGADGKYYDDAGQARYAKPSAGGNGGAGLRTSDSSGGAISSDITISVNPQTKEKSYVVPGIRRRFASMAEAQAAQAQLGGGSPMAQSLSRNGD